MQPHCVYRTVWTEGMQAAIETGLGMRRSLADVPELDALVAGLASLGTFSLFLPADSRSQSARNELGMATLLGVADETMRRTTDSALLLRPYYALALGAGTDEGGPYMTIGLMHATEQLASENVDRLARRIEQVPSIKSQKLWSELFGDVEARADQRLLLATVRRRGGQPHAWLAWWYDRDSLLSYD